MTIDQKQFTQMLEGVNQVVTTLGEKVGQVDSLRAALDELEAKVLKLAVNRSYDQKATFGFTDREEAAKFLGFVKGIFLKDPSVKDLTQGVDSEGGYLVPIEWRAQLIQMLESYGVARQFATVLTMGREELVMPKLTSGVQVYWIGEGKTITNTQPAFGEFRMVAKKMAALVPMTSELLSDSAINIANLLLTLFAQAIAREEDRVAFTGDVANNSDPFNGVLYDPDVTTKTLASGKTTFGSIDADDLADVVSSIQPVAASGARFFLHRTVLNVIRKLQTLTYDGTGLSPDRGYIWSPPNGSDPGSIWGYPYTLVEVMPSINDTAVSTPYIIFGNMMHYYIADRESMSIARSEHVGFAQDKIYLRIIQRESMAAAIPEAFTVIKTAAS